MSVAKTKDECMGKCPEVNELLATAQLLFKQNFPGVPDIAVVAPGRVNLIGEHTDYNMGYVLPMALPLVTVMLGRANGEELSRVKSEHFDELATFDVKSVSPGQSNWANYVKGVVASFHDAEGLLNFDGVVVSSVPLGGGLSSSAALEVSVYTFLEELTGSKAPSLKAKALACQAAEHKFAGMPCGIMDQLISVMGQHSSALLIDCRNITTKSVRIQKKDEKKEGEEKEGGKSEDVCFLIINSNVKHQLTGSEYPSRRTACLESAEKLGVESLRDINLEQLKARRGDFDALTYRRIHHVVTEISRTVEAAHALSCSDYHTFGKLMTESHKSLRDDYEVSCLELDKLVDIALKVDGVYGSRMTGGGFGGCTVTLVKQAQLDALLDAVVQHYQLATPTFYTATPSLGARPITDML